MKRKTEIEKGIADVLKNLRIKKGYSKFKIANELFMDVKTWTRYEEGETTPSVSDFLWIFSQLGESALRPVLNIIYQDVYKDMNGATPVADLKKAALHYIENVASDRFIKCMMYIILGNHGSNLEPQIVEFCMIDNLPLHYRCAIARMVKTFYSMAEQRGELIYNNVVDTSVFDDALKLCEEAVCNKMTSYTGVMEK